MKKSYISILLLFLVMILAISAASAAEIDETSDSALQAVDEAPIEEAASDSDVAQATDDADVIAAGDGNNFTSLQYLIDNAGAKPVSIEKDYVKASGEDAITISNSVTIMDKTRSHKIDANGVGGIFKIKEKNVTVTLIGLTFVNGNSDSGAAINSVGDLFIEDCVFTNNTATGRGGAVYIGDVQETVIANSKFYNNTALSGGAISWDGDNGELSNCEFEGNKANDAGGAVFWFGDNGYIDASTFRGNTAGANGGALHWMTKEGIGGNNGTLIRSQFINNKAGANGGAVFWNGKDGHVYDTDFNANEAPNAGAVYWAGNEGTIKGGEFKYNKATGNLGGAIFAAAGSLDIESIFQENTALNGGAIALNAKGNIADSIFTNNAATSQGGALFALNTDASVTGSHFIDNSAVAGGKAIYFNNGALALSNNIIEGDDAEIDVINGEVISQINVVILSNDTCSTTTGKYMVTANITDDNNNIIANADGFKFVTKGADVEAKYNATTKLYEGLLTLPAPGVFTVNASYTDENLIVKTATIQNYKGTYQDLQKQINEAGSTLDLGYDFAYTPDLDGASFVDGVKINKTLLINGNGYTISGSNAARIFQVRSAPLTLSNAVLTKGNASEYGGAILVSKGTLILASVNLTNNTAGVHGGAIYYVNALYEDSFITNCIFENNEAVEGSAGAIFFEDTDYSYELTIAGSNFTDNKAGAAAGAIYINIGYVGIDKSNFINNIADEDDGGAVYVGANAEVKIQNSVFNGNEAVKGNAIYKLGELSLSNNTINTENADIYNGGNTIYTDAKVTTFNATVAYGEKVNLTAIVTDDNDNLIYDSAVYFKIDGKEYDAKYNESTKRYELKDQEFKLATGNYPITMVAENIENMNMVETGNLTATPKKGTFSDLQYQINASNGELNLSYNFTYDADFDADSFPEGVVIGDDLTINGNGYTISANGASRIFYFDGYVGVVLNDVTLANGKSAKHGGAICAYGADLTVNHVNFVNNTATNYGGAICFWPDHAGDLTVKDCYFENNSADFGGAVFFDMKEYHMTIMDSAFVNNNATSVGGAIYVNDGDLVVNGTDFINNSATNYGGAIYVNNGDLVVNGTDFINNSAIQYYGGAICYWTDDTDLIINGGIFENNSANDDSNGFGGAIFFNVADHSLKIDGADFVNNEARNGGAIYILNGNLDTTDTYFIENSAANYGGAIQIWPGPNTSLKYNLTITGGLFENNTANTFGGAIYFRNNKLIINGTTFANNIATNDGGAIYQSYGYESTIITDTDFINNRADNAGAIFIYGNGITIEGSTFNNNSAVNDYGAIYYKGGKNWFNIDDTKFINNSANNYGALYAIAATGTYARVNVVHSEFTENKAIAGNAGAVFIHDLVEEAYFTDVDFTANTATGIGGAVYVENIPYFTVNDCDFNDNEAVKGSAIFTQANNNASQWTKIINSRFSGNSAVGTIYNEGQIALNGNTINTTYAEIVNYGIITSAVNAVALGNKTVETAEDTYNLTAVLCDDKDNLIFNPDFKFIVNGVEKDFDSFDYEKGYLLADYPITLDYATYLVNATTTGAADLVNKFGIIKNLKIGTFTDLQNMINNAAEGSTLVLPYNFTYNAEIDGDALKAGVVINKALTVDGNGSTISGADAARIFQLNADSINIKNTTFTNGHANTSSQEFADWGGAIYSNGAYEGHVISDCKFYNNTAYNGGAICLASDNSVVTGCEFENNNANASGGAVFLYGLSDTISDSTFKFNIANELGGAVACLSTKQAAEITNSVFIGNSAFANGGAVSMQGAAGKITDSNFTGNAALNAGAVYWGANGGSITGGEFIKNGAIDNLGGAIFAEGTGLTITSTFTENYAENGGAIAVFKDATIIESRFTNNTADNYGGAIYVNGSAKLDITKSVMKNNSATVGSSIYSNGTIGSTIVNATILDNKTWNDTGLGDIYVLNATLTDDMGNSIYDPNFRFTVNGDEIADEPLYDNETGLYTLGYVVEKAGLNVISTSYNAINLQVFTGALDIPLANVTEFTVFAFDNLEGENATVFVTLIGVNNTGLDSIVTVIVNNKEYAVPVENGTGNITIENLAHGQYPVVAMFEDPNYEYTINSTVFNVKGKAVLNITEITVAEYGDVIEITINLTDSEGNPLSGVVTIDNVIKVLVEEGIGTFVIDTQPDVGKYSFQAVYAGDKDYFGDLALFNVTVTAKELNQSEVEFYFEGDYDNGLNITITSPVDGNYTVDINGTNVTVEVVNGTGSAIAKLDKPDDYTAVITLDDENYSLKPIEYDVVYKLAPGFTVEISGTYPNAEIRIVGTPGTYHVNIDEFDTINITVNESELGVAPIEGIAAGDYTAFVSYDANDEYRGGYKEVDFTIDKASITEFTVNVESIVEGENATVFITLIGVNGTGLDSTVTVIVDNKEYDIIVINGTGNTTIENLAHGQYTVVAMFEDPNYEPAINSTVFYVKAATILTVESVEANYSDVITLTVKLTDSEGNPLTGIVKIMGEDVLVQEGEGTLIIDTQPVGTYNWTAVYEGDNDYMNSSADFTVTVNVKELTEDDLFVFIEGNHPDNVTVYIKGPVGKYNVTVDGKTVTVIVEYDPEDESSWGEANITGLTPGVKVATITINDPQFKLDENVSTYEFEYLGYPEYTVNITGTYPNAEVIIRGTDGNYSVYIDEGHQYEIIVKDGVGSQNVSGLFAGEYEAHVEFEQDGYHSVDSWVDFTIAKAPLTIDDPKVVGVKVIGSQINITFTLPTDVNPSNVSAFMDGVPVSVDEFIINETTGVYTLVLDGFFAAESHYFVVQVNDPNYEDAIADVGFLIKKITPALDVSDAAGEWNQPIDIPIKLTAADGTPITGDVIVTVSWDVDGKTQVVTLNETGEGVATFAITEALGNLTVTAKYYGDDIYYAVEKTATLTITEPMEAKLVVVADSQVPYGELVHVNVTLTNARGVAIENATITYSVDGGEAQTAKVDEYGLVSIPVTGLAGGKHTIEVTFYNESYRGMPVESVTVTVTPVAPVFTSNVTENAKVGENVTITIIAPGLTGNFTVTVDSEPVTFDLPVIDGVAIINVTGLAAGHHSYEVTYNGDENYTVASDANSFDVVQVPTETALNVTIPENTTTPVFSIELPEDATGYLLVDVDGQQYYAPLVNGSASIQTAPLAGGNHTVNVTYTGDDKYAGFSNATNMTVDSNVTADTALDVPASSENTPTFSVNLPSDATGFLTVDVDGKKYAAVVENGKASISVPGLSEGNHNVTVIYSGDAKYPTLTKDATVNVHIPVYKITQNKNINVVYSAKATYKVLITKDGKAVGAGESVTIKYNGKTYTVKTDANGYATFKPTTKVKVKKYTITATYKGVTVKNTVNVKHLIKASNKKIKKSKKVNKIKVKTNKVNGKYLKGKKLTLKIKGKKVKAKINKKGVATFKLKKSITKKLKAGKKYKYTVTYGKDKVTKKVKVRR